MPKRQEKGGQKMATRKNFKGRIEERKARAAMRQETRNGRNVAEQLTLLDQRLGAGIGAKKERARLAKMMA